MNTKFRGNTVNSIWFKEPYNEKEYKKKRSSIYNFTPKEIFLNIKKRDNLLGKLSESIKSDSINMDLLLYGSQLYFPSPKRDVDLLAFCDSLDDAAKLNKILGGRIEPILNSKELENEFSLFRLNRTWESAQISTGIVLMRTLEKSIENHFNVPITSIRVSKPPAFSIKRFSTFEGVPFWFDVNNESKIIEGERYWLRDYSSWIVDEKGDPITIPFYFEQILLASVIYTNYEGRLNDYLKGIADLANEACDKFNQTHENGKVINAFIRREIFPEWFAKKLELKLNQYRHDNQIF